MHHPHRLADLLPSAIAPGQPAMPGRHHSLEWAQLLHAVEFQWVELYHWRLMREVRQTSARGLWTAYLDNLPGDRQLHDCRACRHFIETFGAIAVVAPNGTLISPLWAAFRAPLFYQPAIAALQASVANATDQGPFPLRAPVWGTPYAGGWSHLAIRRPARGA